VKGLRIAAAVCLAVTGYVHADLYIHGYRVIPFIGPAFLVQASGSFAVALLLIVGAAVTRRRAAGNVVSLRVPARLRGRATR